MHTVKHQTNALILLPISFLSSLFFLSIALCWRKLLFRFYFSYTFHLSFVNCLRIVSIIIYRMKHKAYFPTSPSNKKILSMLDRKCVHSNKAQFLCPLKMETTPFNWKSLREKFNNKSFANKLSVKLLCFCQRRKKKVPAICVHLNQTHYNVVWSTIWCMFMAFIGIYIERMMNISLESQIELVYVA